MTGRGSTPPLGAAPIPPSTYEPEGDVVTQPKIDPRVDPFENDEPDVELPAATVRQLVADLRNCAEQLGKPTPADWREAIPLMARQMRDTAAALDDFLCEPNDPWGPDTGPGYEPTAEDLAAYGAGAPGLPTWPNDEHRCEHGVNRARTRCHACEAISTDCVHDWKAARDLPGDSADDGHVRCTKCRVVSAVWG